MARGLTALCILVILSLAIGTGWSVLGQMGLAPALP